MRLNIFQASPWTVMLSGLRRHSLQSNIFAVKRSDNYSHGRPTLILSVLKTLRLSNPLGSNLSFLTVFGPQLLALDEQGEHMLIWTTEGGKHVFFSQL